MSRLRYCPAAHLAVLLIFGCCSAAVCAQNAKQFVQQAVQTEMRADRNDHSQWLYYETDRKPNDDLTQWVAQTNRGDLYRVLEKNGESLSLAKQRKQMDSFIHDAKAQAKQRSSEQHDDRQAANLLKLLPDAFVWTDAGPQGSNTVLHFKPDPSYHAPSREARVFAAMEGDLEVDTAQHRIASIKGHLIHNVDFGGGLLGKLDAGGSFDVERRQVGKGIWEITATHVHIHGHALLFKTISEQQDDEDSRFSPLPSGVTLQQAERALLKKGS